MSDNVNGDDGAEDRGSATKRGSKVETKGGGPPQFLPKILKRPIMIRMMDGRPIKGVLEAYNDYELLLIVGQGKKLIVFKGGISSIEYEDDPEKGEVEVKRW